MARQAPQVFQLDLGRAQAVAVAALTPQVLEAQVALAAVMAEVAAVAALQLEVMAARVVQAHPDIAA